MRRPVPAADGPIYTLPTDVDDWIGFACKVAGRDLTPSEWRETLMTAPTGGRANRAPHGGPLAGETGARRNSHHRRRASGR